jgi:hypothetical protein
MARYPSGSASAAIIIGGGAFGGESWPVWGPFRTGKKSPVDETFWLFIRLYRVRRGTESAAGKAEIMNIQKQPPIIEDLRSHSAEQVAELALLLEVGAPSRPDPRRPGFFEVEGHSSVYYIFKYPSRTKVLLLGIWERDPIAELVTYSCSAA